MDLLNKLGNKGTAQNASTEGAANAAPDTSANPAAGKGQQARGTDMISQMNSSGSEPAAAAPVQASADANKGTSGQADAGTGSDTGSDWTADSALKEVKKLREENKQYRLKYAEQLERMKQEADARIAQKEQETQALMEKAKELDKIKEEQEDKKRDLSEKLSVREAKLTEMQTMLKIKEETYQKQLAEKERILAQYEADRAAESEVYKSRISEELNKIPEQYKEHAALIVKGAGDPRDALIALNEARLKGMFEDKTVVVNHQVPGARDGARASQERLKEGERQTRASMSSSQKIKTALEQVKGGQPNNAFRTK